jgi:hypothetical protein
MTNRYGCRESGRGARARQKRVGQRTKSGTIDTQLPDLSRQLSLLAEAGFRYIILHKHLTSTERLAKWRSYLVVSPRYEDDEVVVYTTSPVVGSDCAIGPELGPGIGLIDTRLSRKTLGPPDARVELLVVWGTTAPLGRNLEAEITLMDREERIVHTERIEISPTWPTAEWPANAIVYDKYPIEIEPWLEGGKHSVAIRLVDGQAGRPVGPPVEVGNVRIQAPERSFSAPPMDQTAGVRFGDVLELLGYDLDTNTDEQAIHLTLHWQTLRRVGTDYKFFVHLYNVETGALAAQTDAMPHQWIYPTHWWEAGEVVSDEIAVPLENVPPARYQLGIGAYDPETGVRLSIASGAPPGFEVNQGELILPQVIETNSMSIQRYTYE